MSTPSSLSRSTGRGSQPARSATSTLLGTGGAPEARKSVNSTAEAGSPNSNPSER